MIIRKSEEKDIDSIMLIINDAKKYLKKKNINQWQDGYPNKDTIRNDILDNSSYVVIQDNNIIGTMALSFDGEPTYNKIYNGKWITHGKYGVIHRVAVSKNNKGKGIASSLYSFAEKKALNKNIYSLRVDTHIENTSMKNSLLKMGYNYCGIILLENNEERIAFEKKLK